MEPAKEFSIADDKGPQEVLITEKDGVFIGSVYKEGMEKKHKIFGKAAFVLQSKSG